MSENDKEILKSTAPLIIVIILFVIVGKFGISQVTDLRAKINDAKKTQSTLSEKLKILKSLSQTAVSSADSVTFALPKSNPSLQIMSQLKLLASNNLLVLSDIRASISSGDSSNLSSVTTSFNVTGPREQIISFIKSIDSIAPITLVDKMQLSEDKGVNIANISTRTYWAEFPSTIPTVTQSVTDLTVSEKDLLMQISNLTFPSFGETVTATDSAINPNPFGQ